MTHGVRKKDRGGPGELEHHFSVVILPYFVFHCYAVKTNNRKMFPRSLLAENNRR